MDRERDWLREHSERFRLRGMRNRKVVRSNLAGSRFLRRCIGIFSIALLPLFAISMFLNWGKPGLLEGVALSILALIILNGGVWIIDWFVRPMTRVG